jgi:hypothetical protein
MAWPLRSEEGSSEEKTQLQQLAFYSRHRNTRRSKTGLQIGRASVKVQVQG